jgi:hypothetical protein
MNAHSKKIATTLGLFSEALFLFAVFAVSACSFNVHDDVYPLVSAKSRTMATATISPGAGSEYSFTYADQPSIEITCPISGATAYYSIDGGAYTQYTGAFTLPIADPKADQVFTVTAYVSHPEYKDSATVSQTYRFVATTVPTPTISVKAASYYRYDAPPTVSATCSLSGAKLWYSIDGGANYTQFTGSFTVPVPTDKSAWNVNRDVTVTVYASATGYIDSSTVSTQPLHFYGQYAIVTVAGTGIAGSGGDNGDARLAQLNQPQGVCVDSDKNVYIADRNNNRIRMISGVDGTISTIAGDGNPVNSGDGGLASLASISDPISITIDPEKHVLYVASNTYGLVVRTIDLNSNYISRFVGGGGESAAAGVQRLNATDIYPSSVYYTNDTLYIGDSSNGCVWYVDANITHATSTLSRIDGLGGITGVWVDNHYLYTANQMINFIAMCDLTTPSPTFSTVGSISMLNGPFQPCVDGANIFFTDCNGHRVILFDGSSTTLLSGTVSGSPAMSATDEVEGAMKGEVSLKDPMGMFLVPHDGLYVADRGNNRIRKIILY